MCDSIRAIVESIRALPRAAILKVISEMQVRRVAVIFDNRIRRETTGVYCRRALSQLVEG